MQLRYFYILFVFVFPHMINAQQSSVKDNIDSVKVNFMYSYYEQDGLHSPVTGGIGDEKLYDHGRKISISFPLKNNINLSVLGGIDIYTSASTDNINNEHDLLLTETSASYRDERKYASIELEKNSAKKEEDPTN